MKKHIIEKTLLASALACLCCLSGISRDELPRKRAVAAASSLSGGLVVSLGNVTPDFLAELRATDKHLVQGLTRSRPEAADSMKALAKKGLTGTVTAASLKGDQLPYAEDMINVLIVSDDLGLPRREMERALVPGGILLSAAGEWEKPWPEGVDDWTHYNHDSGNTGGSKDLKVAPPKRCKWEAPPLMTRNHFASSFGSTVVAKGRIFSAIDKYSHLADRRLPQSWMLVARDAFNGIKLWERPLPNWTWSSGTSHNYGHDSGSKLGMNLVQNLVTDGKHLYLGCISKK